MHVDDVGAVLMSENTLVSHWEKHIYVRHHVIRDYIEDGTVRIKFDHLEGNIADPFQTDLSSGLFELLTSRYVHHE